MAANYTVSLRISNGVRPFFIRAPVIVEFRTCPTAGSTSARHRFFLRCKHTVISAPKRVPFVNISQLTSSFGAS